MVTEAKMPDGTIQTYRAIPEPERKQYCVWLVELGDRQCSRFAKELQDGLWLCAQHLAMDKPEPERKPHDASIHRDTVTARVYRVLAKNRHRWLSTRSLRELSYAEAVSSQLPAIRRQLEREGKTVATEQHGKRWYYRIKEVKT